MGLGQGTEKFGSTYRDLGTWEVWNVAMGWYSDTGMRSMGSGHVKYVKYLLMSVIIVTCTCFYTCQDGA